MVDVQTGRLVLSTFGQTSVQLREQQIAISHALFLQITSMHLILLMQQRNRLGYQVRPRPTNMLLLVRWKNADLPDSVLTVSDALTL